MFENYELPGYLRTGRLCFKGEIPHKKQGRGMTHDETVLDRMNSTAPAGYLVLFRTGVIHCEPAFPA